MQRISTIFIVFSLFLIPYSVISKEKTPQDATNHRPKIGLVLAGGGAKGSAHIGVIRKLEELNIPIDFVVGTSMGSYIAGMYALGLSADEIEERTLQIDWMSGYSDKVDRRDLSYRNKKNRDEFQINADIGYRDSEFNLPSGYIQGQTMAKLLRSATKNLPHFEHFDDMPIPFRAVALDLGKMEPYVFTHGNLVTAMQASMAIPGALKPIEYDGRLLADGAMVNNLPVDVVREMGADIIIAVDIGSDLRPQSDLTSYFSIIDQLITSMTRSNVEAQIATLSTSDILILPNMGDIGTGEFKRLKEGVPIGEKAVMAVLEKLKGLSISDNEYQQYSFAKNDRRKILNEQEMFVFDKVEVVSDTKHNKEIIKKTLGLKANINYTTDELELAVKRLYSQDLYERVEYEILQQDGEKVLRINAMKKSWGPGFINFMLGMEESVDGNSDISLGASYVLTDINEYGAEWRNEFIFGTRTNLSTEFYTPIDEKQSFYWRTKADYKRQKRNFYFEKISDDQILDFIRTEYVTVTATSELGWNYGTWGVLAAGYDYVNGEIKSIGFNIDDVGFTAYGPYVRLGYDSLDNIFFPTQGQFLDIKYQNSREKLKIADDTSNTTSVEWMGVTSIDNHSFSLKLEFGGTDSELELPTVAQDLGGYRNLSGYTKNQISSRYKVFTEIFYNYRLAKNDFGAFKFPTYLGFSLERGNVWNDKDDIKYSDMINSASVSIGIDSNIGPVILAYGYADTGEKSFYFFVGSQF